MTKKIIVRTTRDLFTVNEDDEEVSVPAGTLCEVACKVQQPAPQNTQYILAAIGPAFVNCESLMIDDVDKAGGRLPFEFVDPTDAPAARNRPPKTSPVEMIEALLRAFHEKNRDAALDQVEALNDWLACGGAMPDPPNYPPAEPRTRRSRRTGNY